MTSTTTSSDPIILHSYFRSSCSYRVRIALHYKQIAFTYKAVNLLTKEHTSAEYASKLNPAMEVPALEMDGHILTQSQSMIEYLEETRPNNTLLPGDAITRQRIRALAQQIASIQSVQNLKVLVKVAQDMQPINNNADAVKKEWAAHWISQGLASTEKMLQLCAGTYCVGEQVTMADCFLLPQVYNARRFGVAVDSLFPVIAQIEKNCLALEAFQKAHPDNQPDAPK